MAPHENHSPPLSIAKKSAAEYRDQAICLQPFVNDSLEALHVQDKVYQSSDYLMRRRRMRPRNISKEERIDPSCREKMCEWCYRVVDCGQFPCTREVVAVTFSYVDRFLDRCNCDRSTFKLATVTSFYLATKIYTGAQISMSSLVQLSRGEFSLSDIQNMEKVLLTTLAWRMHPPTAQTIIHHVLMLFPLTMAHGEPAKTIFDQAIFFAELAVYDYGFVAKDRYFVAVSCILNAIEVLEEFIDVSEHDEEWLLCCRNIITKDSDQKEVEAAQARLWYLYGCSAQAKANRSVQPMRYSEKHALRVEQKQNDSSLSCSPVCVRFSEFGGSST
jgi:Cyclin, N-terminal domain